MTLSARLFGAVRIFVPPEPAPAASVPAPGLARFKTRCPLFSVPRKTEGGFYYFEFPCIRIQGIRKAQIDSDLAAETEDLAKRLPDGAAIEVVEAEHGQTSLLNLSLEDVTIVTDL